MGGEVSSVHCPRLAEGDPGEVFVLGTECPAQDQVTGKVSVVRLTPQLLSLQQSFLVVPCTVNRCRRHTIWLEDSER